MIYLDGYVNTIVGIILGNQDLCKYLYYDVDEPLLESDIVDTSILSKREEQDRRIFAIPFNPDIHLTQKTTLHIEIEQRGEIQDDFYKTVRVNFIILCHNHLWELYTGDSTFKLRPNAILNKLSELFHKEKSIGIGNARYSQLRNIYMNDEIAGYKVSFDNIDFSGNN